MRYLTVSEVIELYRQLMQTMGGTVGILSIESLESAVVDGNKRIGHYAMETFLVINGYEFDASVDEQEFVILQLASGKLTRDDFTTWIKEHIKTIE